MRTDDINQMSSLKQMRRVRTVSVAAFAQQVRDPYVSNYYLMKSQQSILESVGDKFRRLLGSVPADLKDEVDEFLADLELFLRCSMAELYDRAVRELEQLRNLAAHIQGAPEIDSLCEVCLKALLTLTRRLYAVKYDWDVEPAPGEMSARQSEGESESSPILCADDTVICRICDELVPLDLFEEHTKSCLAAYKSEAHLTKSDNDIKEMMEQIQNKFLDITWPDYRETLISRSLPMLHLYFLLERSLNVQSDLLDAVDELEQIQQMIWNLPDKVEFSGFVSQSIELVKEKQRHSYALTNAARVLQQTRVSGSASAPTLTNASIRDFNFMKRISAGAYARVFLAQKKKTGDLYAIKVLQRKEIQQKNQMN